MLGETLDFHHEAFFVQAHQADRFAACACAARSADAVHVVFRHIGNFVIHDMGQVFNVNAAGCDIGGDQDPNVAALESSQGLSASSLALVAMQCHRLDAVFGQVVGHIVRAKLGASEHQNLTPVVQIDDVHQHFFLLATTHWVNDLRDSLHSGVARRDLNALWVLQKRGSQVANFIAEGGRKQQALFFFWHQGQDFFHIMNEAHVEHAVGFVQDQNFNAGQIEQALALQVEQTAWGGYQDIDAAFHAIDLRFHTNATKHNGGLQAEVFAVIFGGLFNLGSQFSCGSEHQCANGFAAKFISTGL